ncbi:post-GPI attachment to proteins factor 2-like isoform X1 [Oncorhynchus nerka]|uniref:post-GPI attachment to proteins factor 2-like isoform X1 n=2 Tax=Oncorhynchus nerka TaxID=8023 RepID=UPI0011302E73|nr:post-GPI attachment to proteins factor 2-like isoform X1 [Oncorhynchus nerka]
MALMSQSRMLQGPHVLGHDKPLIRLSFTSCVVGTVSLPLLGLITCISISSVFHFQDSTETHCKVTNYLPSISASISLSPECHIWRFCIGLHSAPRFLVAVAYFNFYKGRFSTRFLEWLLSCLNFMCAITENFGLLLLTYVSSNETYLVHKEGFVLFIASSVIHMVLTCRLWLVIKKYSLIPEDVKSFHWKIRCLILNIAFCCLAAYFYWKHNMYCEQGSYTFFALFEYCVVFSNMAFHLTAFWDFKSREMVVISPEEGKDF